MAAYNLAVSISGTNKICMCGDGAGNMYVLSLTLSNYKVYKWDRTTLTDISGTSFNGFTGFSAFTHLLCWFSGNLYLLLTPDGSTINVYKWLGGQVWAIVDTGSGSSMYATALYAANGIMAWCDGASFRATGDGTSWADQTVPGGYTPAFLCPDYYDNILLVQCYSGANRIVCDHSGGGVWASLTPALNLYEISGVVDKQLFYLVGALPAVALYMSPNWGGSLTQIPPTFNSDDYMRQVWYVGGVGVMIRPESSNPNRRLVMLWSSTLAQWTSDNTAGAAGYLQDEPVMYAGLLYVLNRSDGIYVRDTAFITMHQDYSAGSDICTGLLDVDANDDYLYIAALWSGNPYLLKLSAALASDPTEVFAPAAGTDISVICGNRNADWLWICGNFGGTDLVDLSIDSGSSWVVKNAAAWAGVAQPPSLVFESDDAFMTATDGDNDLHETEDGGLNWVTNNAALPFDLGAIDRLDIAPNEIVIGNIAASNVQYSPNNGSTFHDISAGLPAGFQVTTLIVG